MCYPERQKYKRTYVFTCCRAVLLYKKEALYFLQFSRNISFRKKWLIDFFLGEEKVWIAFSNLNSTKFRDEWLVNLWFVVRGCLLCLSRRLWEKDCGHCSAHWNVWLLLLTATLFYSVFWLCFFSLSFSHASFFFFFWKLEGKWQNATNHGDLIFCIPFYCSLVS